MKVFIVCPVRNATEKEAKTIATHIQMLEDKGVKVHYPPRDTNQNDPCGYEICLQNAIAIIESDEVHIYWNGKSQGSMFDLGIVFVKNKKIVLINELQPTETKSFENVLLELTKRSRWRA